VSAATVTPASVVREAHAVLHVAMERPDRALLASEIITLADVLDAYAEIDEGEISPAWAFPDLRDEEDPGTEALRRAAERVEAAAEALVSKMAAHCGTTAGGDAGSRHVEGSAE
jgi:hypothetical protein